MLDEKKIKESKKRVEDLLHKGDLIREKEGRFVEFFLKNSTNSFDSARLLFKVSTNQELRKATGFLNFNGFLWVINACYYSMFYMARALLESQGIKIKTDYSVHIITFDALIYYFHLTGKIEKSVIEELQEAGEEVAETLSKEKAKILLEDYYNERDKRSRFTYEMGEIALQNKASTSMARAKRFNEALRLILDK
jgi:uncharacterized protein (UPF0332 family)